MNVRQAWFCPSCQKHHAPHCDTCPGLADCIAPQRYPYTVPLDGPFLPAPTITPWPSYRPVTTCVANFNSNVPYSTTH